MSGVRCHPERSEGAHALRYSQQMLHYVQHDKTMLTQHYPVLPDKKQTKSK
jgi:hypothetical protein